MVAIAGNSGAAAYWCAYCIWWRFGHGPLYLHPVLV